MEEYLEELKEFLRIESVSGEEAHKKDIQRAAMWLAEKLHELGFAATLLDTAVNPVVYAENLEAGEDRPTVLIYGHYDVQSPEPVALWSSKPFEPEVRAGNLYARGVADDKGQLFAWLMAVRELKKAGKLPVNIKFAIEGAEEIGSAGVAEFVAENNALLAADVCVISDSHALSETQPVITYGLRGLAYMEVSVRTLGRDAHSGTYGGNVLNPINVLVDMISKLKDNEYKITIPGFYDNVRKVGEKEAAELAQFPFGEKQIREEIGALNIVGEKGLSIPVRAGARPTLDVNGIWGGYSGQGPKTVIPATAGAKISMRLVPNQSSEEIADKFERYFRDLAPGGVEVDVKIISGAEGVLLERGSKYFKAAEEAYVKVFGKKPLYELAGGSIGVVVDFKNLLGIDSIMMGYGLPDDGLHSPNEKMSLAMIEKGIATSVEFLRLIGRA